ncbi:translation initiation factor SUI1, putative [Plasmodium gallinaceum]|uniref:Translation initiation factor SUI1, putative n=1 Tax=Plasmodium gallinaceum TaxID=5849 RepID=A0A1J1GWI5_PLAGA|nr:translation initiation factor SUI1, putative [Plasmodium gallinaceum]CRG96623.1 translation initiation factor SUI1, putative [Plasmodium gallinaceum]
MFKNKLTLVNKNFLGNKDRKKIFINVKNTFFIEREEDLDDILCKEDTSVCKVQNTKIIVYISKNIPVLFCVNNVIYPTVYTLWKFPNLIPCFVIYPPASEYLLRGADLMIPGICKEINNLEKLKDGNVWGVRVFNNPYIFAVGQCLIEYKNNKELYNSKGKCLKLIHIFNDELWKLGPQIVPDKSFKNKVIDSVEDIVDNFEDFKIYDESKGKNEIEKEKKKENKKDYFGWGSDVDTDQEKENSSQKFIDKNNVGKKKEEEAKRKSISNEKYLENFYKHFKVLIEKNNEKKNISYCLNHDNNKDKQQNNTTEQVIKVNKTNKLEEDNEKKECVIDFCEIEKNLDLNESDERNYNEYIKNDLNNHEYYEKNSNKKSNTSSEDDFDSCNQIKKSQHTNKDYEYMKQEELKKRNNDLEINNNSSDEFEKKKFIKNEYKDDITEEEITGTVEINNKQLFELNCEQQDLLMLYLMLEVLYYINDDNLPLDVSGVYSRMTKECAYIHRNKKFLGELHKCNVSYDDIKKIKNNEIYITLDVKKSSYKKLIKFIQNCVKIKLIKIKEKRNIVSIVNIHKENPLLASYEPTPTNAKKKIENEDENENIKTDLINKGPQVLEFYMPTNKTLDIFRYVDIKTEKNSYFNITQLKDIFKSYIKLENLQDKNDMHLININETLHSSLSIDDNIDKLPYETILNQFISIQQPCYSIIKPYANFDIEPIKIIKGVCPSVHIYSIARMRGKKFVTHITNLYLFHLDLNKFSEYLQKQLACSCTIVISPSTKKEEVLVQGNVVNQIYKILVNNYYLPKKYIVLNAK